MVCSRTNCNETNGLTKAQVRYRKDGSESVRYLCRVHNAEKKRKERKRNPSYLNRATAVYRAKFPDKHKARLLARKKILLRPCEVCGSKVSMRHHEDHSKPLEVVFLCHLHHKQVHKGLIPCPR